MDYDLYLFSNLLKLYDEEFEEMPYDEQYDKLPALYEDFEKSKFNIDTRSAYDCMTDYLMDKYKPLIQGFERKVLEKAGRYLCADNDDDLVNQVKNIIAHPHQNEMIDYIDDVITWETVEYRITCKQFLELIGYSFSPYQNH